MRIRIVFTANDDVHVHAIDDVLHKYMQREYEEQKKEAGLIPVGIYEQQRPTSTVRFILMRLSYFFYILNIFELLSFR